VIGISIDQEPVSEVVARSFSCIKAYMMSIWRQVGVFDLQNSLRSSYASNAFD
jgi:hypothetical protein